MHGITAAACQPGTTPWNKPCRLSRFNDEFSSLVPHATLWRACTGGSANAWDVHGVVSYCRHGAAIRPAQGAT